MRALALGNFDGVHRGHQLIIKTLLEESSSYGLEPQVLTFTPHPYGFFNPAAEDFTLTPDPIKEQTLLELGVSKVHFYPFNSQLASLSASQFITEIIQKKFNARLVVVGEDFAFGKKRSGTAANLESFASDTFRAKIIKTLTSDTLTYSSSAARKALLGGKPDIANKIMSRPFAISAPLKKGEGRVNYGIRPTFGGNKEAEMEVHLLTDGAVPSNVTIENLRVEFYGYLRGEQKFDNVDELKTQVAKDITNAKRVLSSL